LSLCCPDSLICTIETLLWFPLNRHQCFIGSKEHEKRARVHFIPALKDGVFVTLRAPEVIRRILVEVAHVIARTTGKSKLKNFFIRIQAKKGTNIAAVALAIKVLCIVHHLLTVQEMYQEEERDKDDEVEYLRIPKQMMSLDDMIRYVAKAGYEVRKRTPGAGG
jgi:hypothetical protein